MSEKQLKVVTELREAAQAAHDKTNVDHEQALYAKIVAFADELIEDAAPAPANTNTSSPS